MATSKTQIFQAQKTPPTSLQTSTSQIPSSKNTTHTIANLNFTDSKLKKHHPHHCKPQLHRFQAQKKNTHTHTDLLLQAQISQISGFFNKKNT
jgi:hypothetical protein